MLPTGLFRGLACTPRDGLGVIEVRRSDPGEPLPDLPLNARWRLLLSRADQHEGDALRLGPGGPVAYLERSLTLEK